MRLNRGTIVLLLASLAVIVAVVLLSNNQAAAPGETPTPTVSAGGPILEGVDASNVVRIEVRDNTTGARTVVQRVGGLSIDPDAEAAAGDEGRAEPLTGVEVTDVAVSDTSSSFVIESSTMQEDFSVDVGRAAAAINDLTNAEASASFEEENLEQFGLVNPRYTIFVTTDDNLVQSVHIGDTNPNGDRYYAIIEQLGAASITPEATFEAVAEEIERLDVDTSLEGELNSETSSTRTAAGETAEPLAQGATEAAEAEAGGATEIVVVTEAPEGALATVDPEATGEATADATEAATEDVQAIAQATEQMTLPPVQNLTEVFERGEAIEATNAAAGGDTEATPDPQGFSEEDDDTAGTQEADAEATAEGTSVAEGMERLDVETSLTTEEATAEAATAVVELTEPGTAEAAAGTVEPLAEPLVALSGTQTVYLIPAAVVEEITGFVDVPPYIIPTATATPFPTANPYSEVEMTATGVAAGTATMQFFNDFMATLTAEAAATAEAAPGATEPAPDANAAAADTPEAEATAE